MSNSNGRWEFDQEGNVHYVPGGDSTSRSYPPPPPRTPPRHSTGHSAKKRNTDWHWIIIVLAFTIAWPIGLILLIAELCGKWPAGQQVEKEFKRAASAAKNTAKQAQKKYSTANQQNAKTQAPPPYTPSASKKKKKEKEARGETYGLGNIKLFRILGWCLTGVFGFATVMTLVDELTYFISVGYMLESVIPLLAFTLIGVTLLGVAESRSRKLKKFKKYLKLVGDKDEVSLSALAKTMGIKEKAVYQDVEEMLDRDVFPEGYLDVSRNKLVLREGGIADEPEEVPPPTEDTPEEAVSRADATLRHIRQLNDAIPNPELSAKIQRIEEMTAKIFRLLEERPEKEGELRSFLNYYLPQTLKILENYAKLEAQGIEGDNILEAKQKIEDMMDKVVDGYETQLDKLFADDVLDISADLKVMEAMLAKDGLTAENDFDISESVQKLKKEMDFSEDKM